MQVRIVAARSSSFALLLNDPLISACGSPLPTSPPTGSPFSTSGTPEARSHAVQIRVGELESRLPSTARPPTANVRSGANAKTCRRRHQGAAAEHSACRRGDQCVVVAQHGHLVVLAARVASLRLSCTICPSIVAGGTHDPSQGATNVWHISVACKEMRSTGSRIRGWGGLFACRRAQWSPPHMSIMSTAQER
jgi:hypothetical protein